MKMRDIKKGGREEGVGVFRRHIVTQSLSASLAVAPLDCSFTHSLELRVNKATPHITELEPLFIQTSCIQ